MFFKKIPNWLQKIYPSYKWRGALTEEPTVYLTFDDGPHPRITPWVLQLLAQYEATATFFCIGKNVLEEPEVYRDILAKGHTVGNHTHNHLKGTVTDTTIYMNNVLEAAKHINSNLFRPPYGLLKRQQIKSLRKNSFEIVMWTLIPGDWDAHISPEDCLKNVLSRIKPRSIIVLHDSEKAWDRMSYVLPEVLSYCKRQKWQVRHL